MKVKKWYCTNCKRFKRICRVSSGFMGYPDTYHCRCCGTELVKVSEILNLLIKEKIDKISKNNEKEEGNKMNISDIKGEVYRLKSLVKMISS